MNETLKLFVWKNVLHDYTSGMMVAMAHNITEARQLLVDLYGGPKYAPTTFLADLMQEPEVSEVPTAAYVWGGS